MIILPNIKRYSDAMDPFPLGIMLVSPLTIQSGPPLPEGHTDGGTEISKVESAADGTMGVLRQKLVDLTNSIWITHAEDFGRKVGGKEMEHKGFWPDAKYDLSFSEMDEDTPERERRGEMASAGKGGRISRDREVFGNVRSIINLTYPSVDEVFAMKWNWHFSFPMGTFKLTLKRNIKPGLCYEFQFLFPSRPCRQPNKLGAGNRTDESLYDEL
jgi:hypothetical protein